MGYLVSKSMSMEVFKKLFARKEEPDAPGKSEELKVQLYKGDKIISLGDDLNFKVVKTLSQQEKDELNTSTIPILITQLYMHYWSDGLVCEDPHDPTWKNQAVFFWKAEEPFPKKSLPPDFEAFRVLYFIFVKYDVLIKGGEVVPWFGMPGRGTKFFCEINGQEISVPELSKMGVIEYVESVELTPDNLGILTDREEYFYLADEKVARVEGHTFFLHGKSIPIDVAYGIGGLNIVRKVTFE